MLSRQKEDKDLTHRRLTSLATVRSPGYDASSIGVVVEEGGNTHTKKKVFVVFLPAFRRSHQSLLPKRLWGANYETQKKKKKKKINTESKSFLPLSLSDRPPDRPRSTGDSLKKEKVFYTLLLCFSSSTLRSDGDRLSLALRLVALRVLCSEHAAVVLFPFFKYSAGAARRQRLEIFSGCTITTFKEERRALFLLFSPLRAPSSLCSLLTCF